MRYFCDATTMEELPNRKPGRKQRDEEWLPSLAHHRAVYFECFRSLHFWHFVYDFVFFLATRSLPLFADGNFRFAVDV